MKKLLLYISLFILVPSITLSTGKYFEFEPILVSENENIHLNYISKSPNGDIFAAGEENFYDDEGKYDFKNQVIYKSTDNAETWKLVMSDTNERLPDEDRFYATILNLICVSDNVIVALCTNGYFRRSTDGGKSWKLLYNPSITYDDFHAISETDWICIWEKTIYKGNGTSKSEYFLKSTTNSGETWSEINIPLDTLFPESENTRFDNLSYNKDAITLKSGYHEWMSDTTAISYNYLIQSTDFGKNWEKTFLYEDEKMIFDRKTYKYVAGTFKFLSKDDGYWLASKPSQSKEDYIGNPFMHPIVQYTNDGGKTWENLFYDTTQRAQFSGLIIEENEDLLFYGQRSGIYKFEKSNNEFYQILIKDFKSLSENYSLYGTKDFIKYDNERLLIAGGSNYLFFTDLSNPVSVERGIFKIKSKVYPQPAKDLVKAKFYWDINLPMTADKINIYDILGTKINTEGRLKLDKFGNQYGYIEWDCSNVQPGLYLIKISHGTEIRTVKVMVGE